MEEIIDIHKHVTLEKSKKIVQLLRKLGYKYSFTSDSYIPLLEKLIDDVMILKEEVEQYKILVKTVEKEKHHLENALIPFQQDNGRLALENTDLQSKLFEWEQKYKRLQKEIKKKVRENELKVADLEFLSRVASQRVINLERNNTKLCLAYKNLMIKSKDAKGKRISITFKDIEPFIDQQITKNNLLGSSDCQTNDNHIVNNMMDKMNKETIELVEELENLKLENQHQSEIIVALKCQISQKDREICRIKNILEGGRSLSAVIRDCCQQCIEKDLRLKSLEEQLKEAVDKQHEAMSRALHLAEKNQLLERELKDIDKIALAVEKECQNKVKNNLKNIDFVEEKLRQRNIEIKKLEETIANMNNKMERDKLELENLRKEKQMLEKNLHAATGEKKHLNDKINYFLLIEKNLNAEISRMQEINKSLQRQICDMESRVMDILGTSCRRRPKDKTKKQNQISDAKSHAGLNSGLTKTGKKCIKHSSEEDMECFHKTSSTYLLDKVQEERDFYHNECHRLKDQLGTLSLRTESSSELMKQIKELEKEIINLKQDNYVLRRENSSLLKRLECSEPLSCSSGDSLKIILDRLEKERDLALSDISRLESERDVLKERIKLAAETHLGEQSRFEKIIRDNEDRIRRLEAERRELISSQSSQRISLAGMEEKCDEYKDSMRKAHNELSQMKANYCQLKCLQENTDRSMAELQTRFSQTEIELKVATNKIQDLERINEHLEKEIVLLRKEKTDLLCNVTFIEKEKDGLLITLDEKTEKVAKLEGHLKKQEAQTSDLVEKIAHLEKKLEFTLTEKTNRDYGFRSLEKEMDRLKEELQQCELQKEALVIENRRLQDDLASAAKDCLTARRELDAEKQDVDNLKKQLQQYVTEVKKAEELLTKKEAERNQMLEHFRSLSIEATTLETNNHTLESTVENTKTELITAKNKIADLEHEIASKDNLLYNYEKQMADLTTHIAELESKLKQQTEMRIRAEEDLKALRDLCSTLDGQKEALKRMASNQDAEKIQLINEVRRLSEDNEGLNQKLTHERSLSQTLEKSLSNSRQETLEHKITNKDLQMHVHNLQQKVDELTHKLESESQDVRRYQAQCAELSQQVTELRREVTNARFEHARTKEDNRRSLAQCCHSDEDDKDTCFEGLCLENSSRNIPPLNFPEDSDRTFSVDSDTENLRQLLLEDPDNYLRKPYWKLSPVVEKLERKSDSSTASALSSLPEDNGKSTRSTSLAEEDQTKTGSVYPTYSVRGRHEEEDSGEVNNSGDGVRVNTHSSEEYQTGSMSYDFPEQIEVKCEFENRLWETSPGVDVDDISEFVAESCNYKKKSEIDSSTSTAECESDRTSEKFKLQNMWDKNSKNDDFLGNNVMSETDEQTFSLNKS